ncbi:MAG: hypothetical protein WCI22_18905, partial [Actinomycetota bacterium]
MRTSKRSKLAALGLGLALVAAACSSDTKSSPTTTAAGATTTAAGSTTTAAATSTTTAVAQGGTITYAAEQEYTSYNNGAADQGLVANALVLNLTLPG